MRPEGEIDRQIEDQLKVRQFDAAEALVQKKLHLDPDSADSYYWIGVLRYYQGQLGASIENLRRALNIDPKHTDAAICLSVLFNDIGKYDDAKKVFEQANFSVSQKTIGDDFGVDEKFSIKHLEIADLYFRYRRYDEAIEEYVKATALNSANLEIRIRLSKAYAKKGYVTRAMQELQRMKIENPAYLPARLQLGLLQFSQGNILEAELEWEGVLDADPTHREANAYLEMARQARQH